MPKYYRRRKVVKAEQFLYIDGMDGPKTVMRAESLGLSRSGTSLLWEIHLPNPHIGTWWIVTHGDWIITEDKDHKHLCKPDIFKETYEVVASSH